MCPKHLYVCVYMYTYICLKYLDVVQTQFRSHDFGNTDAWFVVGRCFRITKRLEDGEGHVRGNDMWVDHH